MYRAHSLGISLALIFLVGVSSTFSTVSVNSNATIIPGISYVVIIVMENEPLNSVYNCGTNCAYITGLAKNNSLAENYYARACESLPNYLILTGGGNASYACSACDPLQCTSNPWPIMNPDIIDRVVSSGRTWKVYAEDYPGSGKGPNYSIGGCFLSSTGKYVAIHNPFVYYADIESNSSRCSRIVSANTVTTISGPETDDILLKDLQSPSTASNFVWLTPNNCDNMHDSCYGSSVISEGNFYLSQLVPEILNSPVFKTQRSALFITWDEGATSASQQVAAIWAGSAAKSHYCNCTTSQFYSHASFPKTLETVWRLQSLNQMDSTAPAMMEFFT